MKTVTGNGIVTVGDAAPYKKELTVYGATRQNLWMQGDTAIQFAGVTITPNEDGSVTASGTSTTSTDNGGVWNNDIYILKQGATYTLSVNAYSGKCVPYIQFYESDGTAASEPMKTMAAGTTSTTFTVGDGWSHCRMGFLAREQGAASGTYRVMLNEGTEAQPWCPPGIHGVEDLTLVTSGKNLFPAITNQSAAGISVSVDNEGIVIDGTATGNVFLCINSYFHAKQGETLTLSLGNEKTSSGVSLYVLDRRGGTPLIGAHANSAYSKSTDTLSTDAKCCYVRIQSGTTFSSYKIAPQIERGTQATAYEPPQITKTEIDLEGNPLHSLPDGTRDELHVDSSGADSIAKKVAKGKLTADDFMTNSADTFVVLNMESIFGGKIDGSKAYDLDAFETDTLKKTVANNAEMSEYSIKLIYQSNDKTRGIIVAKGADGGDLAAFKSWLGDKEITFLAPYAAEQTIELGSIEMPYMLRGLNNVMAVSNVTPEIELSYFPLAPCSDGIIANDRHSFHDLGQCIASRDTGAPEKKAITKTVPFMSGFYDFSDLYGGIAYESREISYSFELLGDSREDLQRQKSELMEWLSYVHDTEIRDDDIPGWHFIGSFSGYSWDETADGESGTLEVTFLCQPFMEADEETSKALAIGTHTVTNDGQPVNPVVSVASGTATVTINGFVQSVTGETRLSVQLPHGDTSVKVEGAAATLKWKEARI